MLSAIRKRAKVQHQTKAQVEAGKVTKLISNDAEVNSAGFVVGQAKELQQIPSQQLPSFDKLLHVSDLTAGKFLDLSKDFYDKVFPMPEGSLLVVDILLVDENNLEYRMSYSFQTQRLLGHWRNFYLKHKLAPGDALRFCPVGNNKFKVYTLKASKLTGIGGADSSTSPNLSNHHDPRDTETPKTVPEEDVNVLAIDAQQDKNTPRSSSSSIPLTDLKDNCGSDVDVRLNNPESIVNFKAIKDYDDFKKHMNRQIPCSNIPTNIHLKYYELCLSRNMFLHERVTGLSRDEIAMMIEETIQIAKAIKTASILTSHHLEGMEKKLKSFEDSSMEVGFLRESIHKLVKLIDYHKSLNDSRSKTLAQIEDERKVLMEKGTKLDELVKDITAHKCLIAGLVVEVDTLERKSKDLDFNFQEAIDTAW